MQLHLVLKNRKSLTELPIAYRHYVQAMLFKAMEYDTDFSAFLHDNGYVGENRVFKLFTFSPLQGDYSVKDKRIIFKSDISLEIRSCVPAVIQHLLLALGDMKDEVKIADNIYEIKKCILKNDINFASEVKIKTVSPITAYVTKNGSERIFFSPDNEEFYRAVVKNALRKWVSAGKSEADFYLSVMPAYEFGYKKEITTFKSSYITAWHGIFRLNGRAEVINFLYDVGLGSKNSQGFGMFKIL